MASSRSNVVKASNGYAVQIGDMVALTMSAGLMDVTHVGIYVGFINGRHQMVHNFNGIGVEIRELEAFMEGEHWWVREDRDGALPGPDVAQRALSRIGENRYNFIYNNCEHFSNWCKYGRAFSGQADGWGAVPILGQVLGCISGCMEKKGKTSH